MANCTDLLNANQTRVISKNIRLHADLLVTPLFDALPSTWLYVCKCARHSLNCIHCMSFRIPRAFLDASQKWTLMMKSFSFRVLLVTVRCIIFCSFSLSLMPNWPLYCKKKCGYVLLLTLVV